MHVFRLLYFLQPMIFAIYTSYGLTINMWYFCPACNEFASFFGFRAFWSIYMNCNVICQPLWRPSRKLFYPVNLQKIIAVDSNWFLHLKELIICTKRIRHTIIAPVNVSYLRKFWRPSWISITWIVNHDISQCLKRYVEGKLHCRYTVHVYICIIRWPEVKIRLRMRKGK